VADFTSAYLKVEWANKHINDLDGLVRKFVASKADRVVRKEDATTGHTEISFEASAGFEKTINLMFGDAIHNLRSALDHCWVAAVTALDAGASIDDLYFPVGNDWQNCKSRIDNPKAEHATAISTEAGQKLRCVIKDFVKPYSADDGTETIISTLGKLDNIDKHRLLLTLLVEGTVKSDFVQIGGLKIFGFTASYAGPKLTAIESRGDKVHGDFKATVEVLIGEAKLAENQPLIPTLRNTAQFVTESIKAIERCVLTHGGVPP
jgi:hypothetical protein